MMKSRSLNRKMNVFEPCSTLFRISESCSLSVLVESIFMMKNLFHVCEFRLFFHPILFSTPSSSRWIRVRRIILSFHFRETSLKKGKKERKKSLFTITIVFSLRAFTRTRGLSTAEEHCTGRHNTPSFEVVEGERRTPLRLLRRRGSLRPV